MRAEENAQCGIYLAESSTSHSGGNKWGLFAGTEFTKGAAVGTPEIAIPTLNLESSHVVISASQSTALATVEFLQQSIWVPDATGGKFDSAGRIVSAISGSGMLGAFNVKLTNVEWNHLSAYHRPSLGESPGVAHEGRGAFSNFYNIALRSKDTILAGTEIFVDYGENWEDEQNDEELSKSDYAKMDVVINQIVEFMEKYKEELDETQKTEVYNFLVKDILSAAAGPTKGRLIASLLPTSPDDLSKVNEIGGSLMYSEPSSKRSIEWLQKNGFCMDNIKVGASTIKHAGRGAFAQRTMKQGFTITPVPLLHLPEKSVMEMYHVEQSRGENNKLFWHRSSSEPFGKQLLLNYCFGHPESNMLFLPASSGSSFINHSPTPNAKLVWSEHPLHQKDWYELDPETLVDEDHQYLGLLMEIVATRDIEEDEEIFLDYGSEWQTAWDEHVTSWKDALKDGEITNPWPIRALDLNDEFKTKGYMTKAELEDNPYPENIRQMCFLVVQSMPNAEPNVKLWAMSNDGDTTYDTQNLFDCTIMERIAVDDPVENSLAFKYTIERVDEETKKVTIVHNVPHLAITFLDQPDTGDQWVTKGAFRHFIGIPDEIFPRGPWRDASPAQK